MEHLILWLQVRCCLLKTKLAFPSSGLSQYIQCYKMTASLEVIETFTLWGNSLSWNKWTKAQGDKEKIKKRAYKGIFLLESNVALMSECNRTWSTRTYSPSFLLLSGVPCAAEVNAASSLFFLGAYLGGWFMKNLDFRVCLLSWNLVNTRTYPSGTQKQRTLDPCGLWKW